MVVGIATVAFVIAVLLAGGARGLALYVYLVFLAAVSCAAATHSLLAEAPQSRPLVSLLPRRQDPDERLRQLEAIERRLSGARANAYELHTRLRPTVIEIAAARLARRHGVQLGSDPNACRPLLGAHVWELVRPDREPPEERFGHGWERRELEALVYELERI
jgi:hypothetical protein